MKVTSMTVGTLFRTIACAVAFAALCALVQSAARADAKLALPFSDHMVLQRDMPVPVWGQADAGEQVTVEFADETRSTTADAQGKWAVKIGPFPASAEARILTVRGKNTLALKDVLTGDVWLCAGQSNMEASMERLMGKNVSARKAVKFSSPEIKAAVVERYEREVATTMPGIRLFRVARDNSDRAGHAWVPCNPEALRSHPPNQGFSATAYFYAKALHAELKIPIGVIQCAVGGTRIEAWMPPEAGPVADFAKSNEKNPGRHFRSMVQPLAPLALRGVIWYQGESNVIGGDGLSYAPKMEALIRSWRGLWRQPDLPFYFVQLPRYDYTKRYKDHGLTPESLALFREAQALTLRLPHTGMAVTIDLGDAHDIHPYNKWDVGQRLAWVALAKTYGRTDIVVSGPEYKSLEKRGDRLVLHFDDVAKGLVSRDGKPLRSFTIAGADRKFLPANAVIDGQTVVVSSPAVADPVAVRFAWKESDVPNLFNRDGLPARPFRTDTWPAPSDHAAEP